MQPIWSLPAKVAPTVRLRSIKRRLESPGAHGFRVSPTLLLAGSLGAGYEILYDHGIDAIVPIADQPMDLDASLAQGGELLERAAERPFDSSCLE